MDANTRERIEIIRQQLGLLSREIGERRDKLRKLSSELSGILETVSTGHSSIRGALRQLDDGIDEVSALL